MKTEPKNSSRIDQVRPIDWTKPWQERLDSLPRDVRLMLDTMSSATASFEVLEQKIEEPEIKRKAREEIDQCDLILGRTGFEFILHMKLRAERSDNTDLLCDTIGSALMLCETLPDLIEKFANLHPNDMSDSENFMARFASTVCHLTERLEKFTETHAGALQPMAKDYPYWPILHFKNTAANNHFPLIASRIKLGETCVIHTSEQARYSLQVPLNKYVWELLLHFQDIHRLAEYASETKRSLEDVLSFWIKSSIPEERMAVEELPIYEKSHRLPSLTKANAKVWADVAIVPYVKLKHPDLRKVSAFKGIDAGPMGRRYAPVRKAIIQSLASLAKN